MSATGLNCADARARMDELIDRMTPDADTALLEEHLASCEGCAAVLKNRRILRVRVRGAVRNVEAPPDLGHRIQFAVAREGASRTPLSSWFGKTMMAVAAALLITAGAFYFRPERDPRTGETQQQFLASLSRQATPLMRVGLNQHVHCGVFREYPAVAPALTDMARENAISPALIDAVESHAPAGLHVVMAHHCHYRGREYSHIVARGQGHLLSLLITRRGAGEDLAADLKAVATQVDLPLFASSARSGSDAFAVDAFETHGYLVFLVSDSSPEENLRTLEAMTPQVRAALL